MGKAYPELRFGQLTCMASAMAGEGHPPRIDESSDDAVLSAIREDLSKEVADVVPTAERLELTGILDVLGARYPEWSFGKLLWWLAAMGHLNIYDAEDHELLQTSRSIMARSDWFERYMKRLENHSTVCHGDQPYRCPCCRHRTLSERGGFEICPVCYWEDDGQDEPDADIVRGGPNGPLSLRKARENYAEHKVCDRKFAGHVRPPRAQEI
jgi:hypothetical protein